MEQRLQELENSLKQSERERKALEKDVETLCMQKSEFSGSEVLGLRIRALEGEVLSMQSQLSKVSAERDSIRDDLLHHRQTRKEVDNSLRREIEKNTSLEKELQYYLTQSGAVIAERDKALIDSENAKRAATELRQKVSELQSEAQARDDKLAEAHRRADVAEERSVRLAAQAAESRKVEPLQNELKSSRAECQSLTAKSKELSEELDDTRSTLQNTIDSLRRTKADDDANIEKLESRSKELETSNGDLTKALNDREEQVKGLKSNLNKIIVSKQEGEEACQTLERKLRLIDQVSMSLLEKYSSQNIQLEKLFAQLKSEEEIASIIEQELKLDCDDVNELSELNHMTDVPQCVGQWVDFLEDLVSSQSQEKAELAMYKYRSMALKTKLAQATTEKVQAMLNAAEMQRIRRKSNMT